MARAVPPQNQAQTDDDAIMSELEATDVFDESRVALPRRIAMARAQMQEWDDAAYSSKLAYQTNKELGLTAEELAPFIRQFTRARNAAKYLAAQVETLESELRATRNGHLSPTSAA